MEKNYKLQIYKGMIQYLLDSTNYTLKDIADLTNSSIKIIRAIYCDDLISINFFSSELQLVKIFQVILELNVNKRRYFKHCIKENIHGNIQY